MSNVKSIRILGIVPFDMGKYADETKVAYEKFMPKLAEMNMPAFGLKIQYTSANSRPNNHGGKTTMYYFQIEGHEAVNSKWLQALCDDIKAIGGEISKAIVFDIEAEEQIDLNL